MINRPYPDPVTCHPRQNHSVDDVIITKQDLVLMSDKASAEKPKKVYYESLISKVAKKAQISKFDNQVNNTQEYYTPVDLTK